MLIKAYGVYLVHLEKACRALEIDVSDFHCWLDYCHFPYMLVKHPGECYFETEAFQRVLLKFGGYGTIAKWRDFTARKNIMRTLSKADKCAVAASQGWRCARCKEQLTANFDCDHVIQFAITCDDSRHNLQALHPHCHREKTKDDLYLLNPHFGYEANKRLKSDEQNRAELRAALQTEKVQGNVFSNYFLEKTDTL